MSRGIVTIEIMCNKNASKIKINCKKDENLTKIYSARIFQKHPCRVIIKGLRMSRLPKGVCYEQH